MLKVFKGLDLLFLTQTSKAVAAEVAAEHADAAMAAVVDAEVKHNLKLKQLQVVVVAEHVVAKNKSSLIRIK
jgi:molybdate-binding protein